MLDSKKLFLTPKNTSYVHNTIKYGLICLFIIVIMLFITVGALIYNPNILKPLIVQWVQTHKQRVLVFDSDIQLTLHPNLEITLGSLTLSEHNAHQQGGDTFLSLQNGHMSLSLNPLLHKKWVINNITLNGLKVALIRYEDGRTNIDDLLTSEDSESKMNFNLNQIRITNVALTFNDQLNKQSISLKPLNIAIDQITPKSFEKASLITQGKIEIQSSTQLLQNQLEVRLNAVEGRFTQDRLNSVEISLFAKIQNLEQQLIGNVSISEITYDNNQYKSDRITTDLNFIDKAQSAQINLQTSLAGHLKNRTLALQDLNTQLTYTKQAQPDSPIQGTISGHINADALSEKITAELAGRIQDSNFKALFNAGDFDKLALNFDVNIDQLNIDQFIPAKTKITSSKAIKNQKDPEENIDLSFLRTLNANGQIHIGEFHAGDIQSSDILFKMYSDSNTLHINRAKRNFLHSHP